MVTFVLSFATGSVYPKTLWRLAAIEALIWVLLASGCIFKDLKREIHEEEISYALVGRVENIAHAEGDVFLLLYAKRDDSWQLECFTLPDDSGYFSFTATAGTYLLAGFDDRNANLSHDPGEPAGAWGKPDEIVVYEGPKTEARKAALEYLPLNLTPGRFPVDSAVTSVKNVERISASLIKLGQLADWENPAFDEEHGSTGYWKPVTFVKQHGIGIYFMAPYDRNKIPVLFVHGATGTPRGWKALADSLDDRRFQPWVFYYPSGLRLTAMSTALNKMVKQLQIDYGFERMAVVAHSMGGLVSRGFIIKHLVEDGLGTVRVLVSISTPWGGVSMAATGVKQAPQAIPSWHDVAPQSEFIQRIFADPLHPLVPHYLIFSYHGICSM